MKLTTLHEARYSGEEQQLQQLLQYFYAEPELSDEEATLYFPHEGLIARNRATGVMNDEVMWIKIVKDDPSRIGVMYADEEHDWLPTQEVVEGFHIYKVELIYGK
jgi:hypothetical protein